MKKVLLIILMLMLSCNSLLAEDISEKDQTSIKVELQSNHLYDRESAISKISYWNKEEKAYYLKPTYKSNEMLKEILIRLYVKECEKDKIIKDCARRIITADCPSQEEITEYGSERYAHYYCSLSTIITEYADPNTFNCLLEGCTGSNFAKIGEPLVPFLIKRIPREKGNVIHGGVRPRAVRILTQILKSKELRHSLSPASVRTIKKELIVASKDIDWGVRNEAVRGLGELVIKGHEELIPLIMKMSLEDVLLVREEAKKILEKLKKEGKIKEKESGSNLDY